ncbi:Oxoglutarate and iron-dependent oxygenase degradation C-term-domain-containing protein [Xylaria bambusicola]|uniref:Oxoglutarate and iron-dependent oxygenase degradation C-term-domain-containing protein n=1 Tax=Xylaria bambusicola TaxID=326684 RepID=UPI0020085CAE|nr:Oxoglutarate and iron-dependent oxygenase degradation C-term-domain-containing protein [Xylaria bambusicola]KAI0523847.1 Oxoglutarate and iron-dependent oxygenase degradation C-term-domain-containing protein [Xylaria bambusicola]
MPKAKRKAEEPHAVDQKPSKKKAKTTPSNEDAQARFRKGLFDKKVLDQYTGEYSESAPYKHAVIHELIDDKLLRAVRDEIKDNVSFTPKETDIYKIHQSGDLANLDGLGDEALAKLPSLLALRDAMYSQAFRDYVAHVTGCGPLSGRKTDMAINVYTPGCYLLCHDDVIGSRRVSYILYLTDPDIPWKPEWGGALRLFPVKELEGKDGQVAHTPTPDVSKVIPPAWNQLSFFAVQPGRSFHDVEEVYHAESKEQLVREGGRVRMAISGWFHIPQIGEPGYVEGAEERNTKNSGLMQLQGNPDQYDEPRPQPVPAKAKGEESEDFDEADLEFLLRFMAPTYLTPDTIEQVSEHFGDSSSITLPNLLGKKFAARLRTYILAQEKASKDLPEDSAKIEKETPWRVAKPPHKHRYLYQQSSLPSSSSKDNKSKGKGKKAREESDESDSPIRELLDEFLPSPQFRHWLQMATGCTIESHDFLARRFRRGKDYTLATGHEGKPRLELNLGITPTKGWGDDDDDGQVDENEEENETSSKKKAKKDKKGKSKGSNSSAVEAVVEKEEDKEEGEGEVGGHEVYMAGDEGSDNEDAAIYKSSHHADDEDNILFFQAAAWNRLSLVLRDSGALRFVKYVSRRAKGDRWDVSGTMEVEEEDGDDEGEGEEGYIDPLADDTEEEWKGFSPSEDSDSD